MIDFENLRVTRIIVHEVPTRTDSDRPATPVLANSAISLSADGLSVFQKRIVDAVGNKSHCIELEIRDRQTDSAVALADGIIDGDGRAFIQKSKEFAKKLSEAQISRRIPGGIVIVFCGTISAGNLPICGIIKAETQEGFHKTTENGRTDLQFLSELFLTPQQKLYKIGIFIRDRADLKVFVYDHNLAGGGSRDAAKYFFEAFLGCQIAESSSALSKAFYENTRDFIDNLAIGPQEKTEYHDALYAYLKLDQNQTINTTDFSTTYLKPQHQEQYANLMEQIGFPQISIVKDISLFKSKLRRRVIRFTTGVSLIRPNGKLAEVVKVIRADSESTDLRISGQITGQDI